MSDMFAPAVLLDEPTLEDVGNEMRVYTCDARTEPFGRVVQAIMLPPSPGAFSPWRKGDRVLLGIAGGGCGYVLGAFANGVTSTAHIELRPRGEGEVRIGPTGGEYQPLALFDRLSAEVVSLKAQIDALASHVQGMTAQVTASTGVGVTPGVAGPIGLGATAAVSGATIAGGITGGDPAAQLKGVKAP